MPLSLEILILVLMSVLLVFQVQNVQMKPGKINEKKYVQYVADKPILTMSDSNVQFDGDVYYATDDMTWDWNDSHQEPSQKPSLYLADPFINIQHAPGDFQGMF